MMLFTIRSLAEKLDTEILFVYGIINKLPQFIDAGAPAAYRNADREDLLEFCHEHDVLYAWVSLSLLEY